MNIGKLPEHFRIWIEWYEFVQAGERNGRYLFGLPTERALRLNVDFALIDDSLWEGEPADLHAEMRRLIDVARQTGANYSVDSKREPDPPQKTEKQVKPPRGKKMQRPKTAIGRAMVDYALQIALQASLLIPLVDQEIERLKAERPNSDETIAHRDALIAKLEKLRADTRALRDTPNELNGGVISENEAIEKANAFLQPFRDCWSENGKAFVEVGIRSGLFLGAISIASLLGIAATPAIATTVLGAIAAEKPLATVLKAAKGVFKFGGT